MTALELAYLHPVWSVAFVLTLGISLATIVRAFTEPLAPCRRGNCPRCNGTGGEERIRADAKGGQP